MHVTEHGQDLLKASCSVVTHYNNHSNLTLILILDGWSSHENGSALRSGEVGSYQSWAWWTQSWRTWSQWRTQSWKTWTDDDAAPASSASTPVQPGPGPSDCDHGRAPGRPHVSWVTHVSRSPGSHVSWVTHVPRSPRSHVRGPGTHVRGPGTHVRSPGSHVPRGPHVSWGPSQCPHSHGWASPQSPWGSAP